MPEFLKPPGKTESIHYRNEWKYLLSYPEAEFLKRRLLPFMKTDPHAKNGQYMIRSLYFDDWRMSSYEEKIMGVMGRKKWRIRIYNYSDARISLERKIKHGNYIHKDAASLTREEFERILDLDFCFLLEKEENLCREFYVECITSQLRPKVIVDYERTPLILEEGTVRITFDSDVRAAVGSFDIFDPELPTLYVFESGKMLLEVKYTEFLPQIIKQCLPADGQEFTAFSKYTSCFEKACHLTDPAFQIYKTIYKGRIRDEYERLF